MSSVFTPMSQVCPDYGTSQPVAMLQYIIKQLPEAHIPLLVLFASLSQSCPFSRAAVKTHNPVKNGGKAELADPCGVVRLHARCAASAQPPPRDAQLFQHAVRDAAPASLAQHKGDPRLARVLEHGRVRAVRRPLDGQVQRQGQDACHVLGDDHELHFGCSGVGGGHGGGRGRTAAGVPAPVGEEEGPGQAAVHARGDGVHACISGEAEGQVRQQRQFVGIMESYMLAVSQTEPS
ncbi:hypothetical protein THAOC_28480 [Thalassiosira oceanica]|uniref:Uncharacterized protein n=1 Tax=Thalassiosira oceanica TaxID=159749 RepID=K0RJ21_THAOC|nr:hypothetical protein THAOC_28480 [Thalassiosira oceanica]|eukprot:EJK52269.1 hypothetical protein THAOC_28480 [Thalassiosira oceanica]